MKIIIKIEYDLLLYFFQHNSTYKNVIIYKLFNNIKIGGNMILENNEVKNAIYGGMSIFNVLKNSIVKVQDKNVSIEDKKYLSLYLGIINSENRISLEFNDLFSEFYLNYELLDMSLYMDIYLEHFIEIFRNIDFDSIDNYFKFLLEKEIVKKVNIENGLYDVFMSNKKLVKKIN